jgi:hypothetical protein
MSRVLEITPQGDETLTDAALTLGGKVTLTAETKGASMTRKTGPSPEYRDLVKGRISPDQYVRKLKKDVNDRLGIGEPPRREQRRAAASS